MSESSLASPSPSLRRTVGWDVLLVAFLTIAQLQITSLAEIAVLPTRVQDVLRHPWLGGWLSPAAVGAFGEVGPRPGEPIGLLLIATALGLLLLYALVDLLGDQKWRNRLKWILLVGIVLCAVYLPALEMILLRQQSGPASYSHDGGVIQTEATIQFLLAGKNPYRENYTQTPMAEWGFSEYRSALYHYPYLPWTFLFSAPFYLAGQALGVYDQRVVYLLLMAVALAFVPRLVQDTQRKLALVAVLALNPIMGLDLIFGQNDSFVLCWVLFALVALQASQEDGEQTFGQRHERGLFLATLFFGLACASKPTAWFFAPFFGLLLVKERLPSSAGWADLTRLVPLVVRRAGVALAVFAVIVLPYAIWDGWSLYDDVWRWSNGQGETGYQIWGWGASNFVLAAGAVANRFSQWPFQLLELLIALPVLFWFIRRQKQNNTIASACWHYGIFLLVFFYGSRFLNENYLGYILPFLTIGVLADAGCRVAE
ncbi:MAG: glycosyltransferase 87 family protein [Caldilineaceae bacterium]